MTGDHRNLDIRSVAADWWNWQGDTMPNDAFMVEDVDRVFFMDQVIQRTQRGLQGTAEQGHFVGHKAPYPYRKVRQGNGFTLAPDPIDADTARGIFTLGLQEWTDEEITEDLNEFGVPSPSGGPWTPAMVGRVLTDLTFTGTYAFGKHTPDSVWVPNAFEPIVSQEEFDRVQTIRRQMYRAPKDNERD